MPGYDQSGPMGAGPMTGRGRGMCSGAGGGYGRRCFQNRGLTRGAGVGFGNRRRFMEPAGATGPVMTSGNEIARLKAEAEWIQRDLEAINQQIETLSKKQAKE